MAIGPDELQPAVDVPAVAPALLAMLAVVLGTAGAVRLRARRERGSESR